MRASKINNKLFVLFGNEKPRARCLSPGSGTRHAAEPNIEILKRSPCLDCDLYSEETMCPHVGRCSKIDEFQRIAASHCTLFKDQDVFSELKI